MSAGVGLRVAFEHAPIGMAVVQLDGLCCECNPALAQLLGYSREELARLPLFDLTHPDDAPVSALQRQLLLDGTDQSFALENRYVKKDGSVVWVLLSLALVRAPGQAPQCYIAQMQDISERRRNAETLVRYAEEIEDLYQNAPCGYHSVDARGYIVRINDTELRWLGYAREEVLGRLRTADILAPESRPGYETAFQRLRECGEVADVELSLLRKDGSRLDISLNATAIRDGSGKYLRSRSTLHDISERRRIEALLAAQNARSAALLRTAGDAMLILDGEARVRDVNHALCRMLGYPREALLAMHPAQWDARHSALELREMLAEGCTQSHVYEAEWRARDGALVEVEIHATRVTLDGEGLLYISARDAAERKRHTRRERAHRRVLELLARGAPLAEALGFIAEAMRGERPDWSVALSVIDARRERLRLIGAAGLPVELSAALDNLDLAAADCPAALAVRACERVMDTHLTRTAQHAPAAAAAAAAGFASFWALPVQSATGEVVGVLSVFQRLAGARPDKQQSALLALAGALSSIAIERHDAEERLRMAGHVYQASSEGIMVTDAANRIISVNPAFTTITGYAAGEALGREPGFLGSGETPQESFAGMWRALQDSGRWQGEILNRRKSGESYVGWLRINTVYDQQGAVLRRIGVFSDITERKKSEEQVWQQANFDALTGLPNRRLFRDRLQQELRKAERSGLLLALMFIDLDKFKAVNDRLGHEVGDRLLAEAARRISGCVRAADTVARLGGDEFTVILPNVDAPEPIERVAQDVITRLEQEFSFGAETAQVSASIGIALHAREPMSLDELIARADAAMYAAKSAGRGCFRYYAEPQSAVGAEAPAADGAGEPKLPGTRYCRA
ncbi:MAG: PAS domain S-box protein [Rhodocyclaceae bacterium]|nr:PAS domain S-box protein [Rhodocyclaceae bacterium]MBX3669825.1 PAS domain S-box protein [Rhodocyclaceae bacterium]